MMAWKRIPEHSCMATNKGAHLPGSRPRKLPSAVKTEAF